MEYITESVTDVWTSLKRMNKRQFTTQGVNLGALITAVLLRVTNAASRLSHLTGADGGWRGLANRAAGLVVTSALIIWKSLMLFTGSESPVSELANRRAAAPRLESRIGVGCLRLRP
jgi:hypothetical protein